MTSNEVLDTAFHYHGAPISGPHHPKFTLKILLEGCNGNLRTEIKSNFLAAKVNTCKICVVYGMAIGSGQVTLGPTHLQLIHTSPFNGDLFSRILKPSPSCLTRVQV